MKHKISWELREFYRCWLAAKSRGDERSELGAYQIDPRDYKSDVNKSPTCDILRLAAMYKNDRHLLVEHRDLLEKEFGTDHKPFGSWDECAANLARVKFITKYAEYYMKDGFIKLQKPKRMRGESFGLKQERKHQERERQEQRAQSRARKERAD